jgi:hypothetical protein
MNSNREKILDLRKMLRDKHGSAQLFAPTAASIAAADMEKPPETRLDTNCRKALGIGKAGIHEMIAEPTRATAGLACVMERLIFENSEHLALIDGQDCFDPGSTDAQFLNRFLWVRCRDAQDAIKSADWLLRDGNLPLVVMDLQMNPAAELRRIPASSWYRLRAVAEETETACLVFSPEKLVPAAHSRWSLSQRFSLSAFDERREDIAITPVLERARPAQETADFLATAS